MMRSSLLGLLLLLGGALTSIVHAETETMTSEPGAVPLDPATERRLERYITNDNCPVTLNTVLHDRCRYLLKRVRVLLSKEREGARISPRAGSILRKVQKGTVIRRSIGGEYQRLLESTTSLRLRQEEGGFRRRLRTIEDARERYRALSIERRRGETQVGEPPPPPPPAAE